MSYQNLLGLFDQADETDMREGKNAYENYNNVMNLFSRRYMVRVELVTAAFVALSPQNDYYGNLRSLASVLQGYATNADWERITVSTYNHCRDRALNYLSSNEEFVTEKRGRKILSFYHNILDPYDMRWVTIDGHMVNAFNGTNKIMTDAKINLKEYATIAAAVQQLAQEKGLIPCQLQATLWFARKRLRNIKYNAQLELFGDRGDVWRSMVTPAEAPPYPLKDL